MSSRRTSRDHSVKMGKSMVTWRAAREGSKEQERAGRGWGGGSEQVGRIPVMEGLKCQ